MKVWLKLTLWIITTLLAFFFIFRYLPLDHWQSFMASPEDTYERWSQGNDSTWIICLISMIALIADIFLPIPSHLVLSLNGQLLGFPLGAVINLIGLSLAHTLAYGIGAGCQNLMHKFVSREELAKCHQWLSQWSYPLLILSRPIPLLAETLSLLAGSNRLPWFKYTVSIVIGNILPALLFAWAGSEFKNLDEGYIILVFVALIIILLWTIGMISKKKSKSP